MARIASLDCDWSDEGKPAPYPQRVPLLDVQNLRVHFPLRAGVLRPGRGQVKAVEAVSFALEPGQTLGLVGESGCGKTTVGRAVLRLVAATAGRVMFDGTSLFDLGRRELRIMRRSMQIIFQDPGGSLNPRMQVGSIVGEPLEVHGLARGRQLRTRVQELLDRCGLVPAAGAASRYPHEFSGGQRQRIAIARALALRPRLIVCDEPTSALDVSIQSQILNLLKDLQDEFGLSYLFISHDIAVVHHMCDRIAVMLDGRIIEQGDCDSIIKRPQHRYTQALLAAAPQMQPKPSEQRQG
jgi:ABC-type microcin C transport system duplicated ATPase subunit YejF